MRRVVSARHVAAPGVNQRVRIDLFNCGHEQSFTAIGGCFPFGHRVCRQCEDAGNVIPLEVVR